MTNPTEVPRRAAAGLAALVLGAGLASGAVAADGSWRHRSDASGGYAFQCARDDARRLCAAVYCSPRTGRPEIGLAGWQPPGRADRRAGRIAIDGTAWPADFARAGTTPRGRALWRVEPRGELRRVIRRIKEGYTLRLDVAPREAPHTFSLDGSYRAISAVQRDCGPEAVRPAPGLPPGAPGEESAAAEIIGGIAGAVLGELVLEESPDRGSALGRPAPRVPRGRSGPRPGFGPAWAPLGETAAGRRGDRDVVEIGGGAGRFEALRLWIAERPIDLDRVLVTFGNGRTQVVEIGRRLGPGATRPLELRGARGRVIERVVFDYRSAGPGRGAAEIELWGRRV